MTEYRIVAKEAKTKKNVLLRRADMLRRLLSRRPFVFKL